jgi:hypothetical protein
LPRNKKPPSEAAVKYVVAGFSPLFHYPGSNENSVLVMSMKFGSSDFETDGINKLIEG